MICVVGSGPSGVAAASALLDEGHPVFMLDVGETCEPDRLATARRVASTPPEQWAEADIALLRGPGYFDDDARLKRAYGSTFAYALDEMARDSQRGTRTVQSFAEGGLSHVWGAAVLPATADDRAGWPLSPDALDEGYARVAGWLPIAAVRDELAGLFPFHAPPAPALRPSAQAVRLLAHLDQHRTALRDAGLTFGRSRLAVGAGTDDAGHVCDYVGLCLTGCPKFAIWTASDRLAALRRRPGFTYRAGFRVDAVRPAPGGDLAIEGWSETAGAGETVRASRVMLACGPLATARIVLGSLTAWDRAVPLHYQPYVLLPMLGRHGAPDVEHERLHTLAQVFGEWRHPDVSPFTVHLQFYTYNPLIGARLRRLARWLGPLAPVARARLAGRLMAVQGYLHSDTAAPMRLTARQPGARGRPRLDISGDPPPAAAIDRVVRALARLRQHVGARPLAALREIGVPGDGNHCGGSFPMRSRPGTLETDTLGQLPGLPRVHLVDSSVLPSLPATTFTYTVMANADRIARAVARSGDPG